MTILTIVRRPTRRPVATPRPVLQTCIVTNRSPREIAKARRVAADCALAPTVWTERFQKGTKP